MAICFRRATPTVHVGEGVVAGRMYFFTLSCQRTGPSGYVLEVIPADGGPSEDVSSSSDSTCSPVRLVFDVSGVIPGSGPIVITADGACCRGSSSSSSSASSASSSRSSSSSSASSSSVSQSSTSAGGGGGGPSGGLTCSQAVLIGNMGQTGTFSINVPAGQIAWFKWNAGPTTSVKTFESNNGALLTVAQSCLPQNGPSNPVSSINNNGTFEFKVDNSAQATATTSVTITQ